MLSVAFKAGLVFFSAFLYILYSNYVGLYAVVKAGKYDLPIVCISCRGGKG